MVGDTPHSDRPGSLDLMGHALEQGASLVQQEIQLAKREVTDSVMSGVKAAITGAVAVMALFSFMVLGLTTVIIVTPGHWPAALGFAVGFLIVAVVAGVVALRQIHRLGVPRTVQTVKEDLAWAKRQLTSK